MNKIKNKITLIVLLVLLLTISSSGQDKRAQTGMKFLSVATDSRAVGMGEAVTSLEGGSNSMFFNPAGMARQTNMISASFSVTQFIADFKYHSASVSFIPHKDYGVFGISLVAIDYGDDFIHTIPDGDGALDIGTFSPTAMAIGIGYARALSDKFSIGGNIKYAYQNLSGGLNFKNGFGSGDGFLYDKEKNIYRKYSKSVLAFDFGIQYKTGFKSLTFGMNVKNFSQEIEYIDESFQLPLLFEMGLSMNIFDFFENLDNQTHSLILSIDAAHPRDYDEQLNLGFEYNFKNTLFLRAGYITPADEQGINAGIGIKQNFSGVMLSIDYSYTDFGIFDNLHRFTVNFGL